MHSSGYYTAILNNTGLNASMTFRGAEPNVPYGLRKLPGIYSLGGSPPTGLTQVYYGSPTVLPDADVKADMEKSLVRMQKAQLLKQTKADWVVCSGHVPFNLEVSTEEIKNKFYARLSMLNGQRGTFYNGAAFETQDSIVLWQFTEEYLFHFKEETWTIRNPA